VYIKLEEPKRSNSQTMDCMIKKPSSCGGEAIEEKSFESTCNHESQEARQVW
jgi:hypothetical protein